MINWIQYLLCLKTIKRLVEDIVIPFISHQLILVVDYRKGINQMGAEERIYVLWCILPLVRSVLGPVGEIAHHLRGSGYGWENIEGQSCALSVVIIQYYRWTFNSRCSASHTVLFTWTQMNIVNVNSHIWSSNVCSMGIVKKVWLTLIT